MRFLGNIIWLLFGGFIGALGWSIAGLLACITIIGLPFGLQCFKIASFVLWPFGRDVTIGDFGAMGFVGNVIWIMLCGWELFVGHLIAGLILTITVIGAPFGMQHFKFAKLALMPFGANIYYVRNF